MNIGFLYNHTIYKALEQTEYVENSNGQCKRKLQHCTKGAFNCAVHFVMFNSHLSVARNWLDQDVFKCFLFLYFFIGPHEFYHHFLSFLLWVNNRLCNEGSFWGMSCDSQLHILLPCSFAACQQTQQVLSKRQGF